MPAPTEIIVALLDLIDARAEPDDGQTCDLLTTGDLTIKTYRREHSYTLTLQATVNNHAYTSLPILHWRSSRWCLDPTAFLRVSWWLELIQSKM